MKYLFLCDKLTCHHHEPPSTRATPLCGDPRLYMFAASALSPSRDLRTKVYGLSGPGRVPRGGGEPYDLEAVHVSGKATGGTGHFLYARERSTRKQSPNNLEEFHLPFE